MKLYNKNELKGYTYYSEVNDWIKWDGERYYEDKDGGFCGGAVEGAGISGKNYAAECVFWWEGGWTLDLSSIKDIEEIM